MKKIDNARAERDARQRRLRLAKLAVAALLAHGRHYDHDRVLQRAIAAQQGGRCAEE